MIKQMLRNMLFLQSSEALSSCSACVKESSPSQIGTEEEEISHELIFTNHFFTNVVIKNNSTLVRSIVLTCASRLELRSNLSLTKLLLRNAIL